MADLVVKDLDGLVHDLNALITQFEGATRLQDDFKGRWGQLNANLSMGDFAHNWQVRRGKLVESLKKFRDQVKTANDEWAKADADMAQSLEKKK